MTPAAFRFPVAPGRCDRPGTSRLPWRSRALVAAATAALVSLAGCATAPDRLPERTPDLPGAVKVAAADFPLERSTAPKADPAGPITHVGRTVFARCHRMVVAEVVSMSPAGLGAEVVRVREREVVWGDPEPEEAAYTVLCGARGLAPPVGASALFVLRLLPAGGFEALEVSPVEDADGAARLRTLRAYVAIELLPEPEERRLALLAYLRSAVRSETTWVRANAVREYAAFADAFPSGLEPEDAAALAKVVPGLQDPNLRQLAQAALDRAPSARRPKPAAPDAGGPAAAVPTPRPVPGRTTDIAPFVRRFDAAASRPADRRAAVLDAAAQADRAAAPLVLRALADGDASVREAAAAAAGEVGIADAVPRLVPLAATDRSPPVRRSCVMALGHLRAASAVGTLAGLAASDPEVGREAMFALARIRDAAAVAELRRLGASSGDAERRKLVDFLLSDDFVRQERAMGAKWAVGK